MTEVLFALSEALRKKNKEEKKGVGHRSVNVVFVIIIRDVLSFLFLCVSLYVFSDKGYYLMLFID